MDALGNMIDAVRPGGHLLDLQVIPPHPRVERGTELIAEVDGSPLFEWAEAATAAVDARIAAGDLVEEAVDDHAVRKHYPDGAAVVEDVAGADRKNDFGPAEAALLRAAREPLVVRERCRLRRLRVR